MAEIIGDRRDGFGWEAELDLANGLAAGDSPDWFEVVDEVIGRQWQSYPADDPVPFGPYGCIVEQVAGGFGWFVADEYQGANGEGLAFGDSDSLEVAQRDCGAALYLAHMDLKGKRPEVAR